MTIPESNIPESNTRNAKQPPLIVIDARLNGYRQGGIAEYTYHIIHALAEQDPYSQYCIFHRRGSTTNILPVVKNTQTPVSNFRRVDSITPCHHRLESWTLGVEVARLRPHLLHSPDFIPPRFGARRKVITIHDLSFLLYPQFQTADSLRYYAGKIKRAVQEADHILVYSQATRDDLINLLQVPREKITMHVLGVSSAYYPMATADIAAVKARFNLPRSYILFVGTFEPRKNLIGLFDAYHMLRGKFRDLPPLVLVGRKGWLYEPIFQRVADLRMENCVQWLENVEAEVLPAIYNGAAVLITPSFYEGFGFPPLEAMACGVPTVVANRGSLPEVVGDTGALVNPDSIESIADGLYQALTDENFRRRSSAAGIERAKLFNWQATAAVVLRVYHNLLEM